MGKGLEEYHGFRASTGAQSRTSYIWSDRFWGQHRGAETDPIGGAVVIAAGALLLGLAVLLVPVVAAVPHAFSVLDRYLQNRVELGLICGIAATLIGAVLFQIRQTVRGVYAFLEIAFAFATAATAVTKLSAPEGDMSVWFAFAGAAYLVVRGLDNLNVAKSELHWPWSGEALPSAQSSAPPVSREELERTDNTSP